MKEIVLDFRRYHRDLGFTVGEAMQFARTRHRARRMLNNYEKRPPVRPAPVGLK